VALRRLYFLVRRLREIRESAGSYFDPAETWTASCALLSGRTFVIRAFVRVAAPAAVVFDHESISLLPSLQTMSSFCRSSSSGCPSRTRPFTL
jgi:hypothetical protein